MLQNGLTLSLPHFWRICSLSATFILPSRGILRLVASTFSKILFFHFLVLITFYKYSKSELSIKKKLWTTQNVCKSGSLNRVGKVVQVADRRRWQSAMTSPIGDVGSERVKKYKCMRKRSPRAMTPHSNPVWGGHYPHSTLKSWQIWCHWGVNNPQMNLQSKFG